MRATILPLSLLCIIIVSAELSLGDETAFEQKYKASTIPPSLLVNAHAVVRFDQITLEVASIRSARYRFRKIVTVLDAEGRDNGELYLRYDKFFKLKDVDAKIFDANGEEIRSLEDRDVNDYAATSEISLYEDDRVRIAKIYHHVYPYTIDYEFEYEYNGYLGWPAWFPQERKASVEYTSLIVVAPKDIQVRHWTNAKYEPTITDEVNKKRYVWSASMFTPYDIEPVGPSSTDQYDCVRVAPAQFELDGYRGDLSSWKSLGEWNSKLWEGRQTLPERVYKEVLALVEGATTPIEKIRRVYRRLQSTTRYVSVQLGIGGMQPFDAAYVCERGYGDCKALSNYMIAMLKAVGVNAYPVLIYSDTPPQILDPKFPIDRFNHIIVAVPLERDTVWLECTSQTIPMGHLGRSTENRYALLIAADGGVLVRTPASKASDNMQVRNATVTLSSFGGATAQIRTTFTGNQQDYARVGLSDATPKEREEWMREHIEIPTFNLQSMDFSRLDIKQPSFGFDVKVQLPRFASVAGSRLLFQPNLMEKRTYVPPPDTARKHPIIHSYAYVDVDTVLYALPEGFAVEALPKPASIETPFAKYSSSVAAIGATQLRYTRRLEVVANELPPQKFNDYRKFFQDVVQADKASAAIVKK